MISKIESNPHVCKDNLHDFKGSFTKGNDLMETK